jgi:hypothetical protein
MLWRFLSRAAWFALLFPVACSSAADVEQPVSEPSGTGGTGRAGASGGVAMGGTDAAASSSSGGTAATGGGGAGPASDASSGAGGSSEAAAEGGSGGSQIVYPPGPPGCGLAEAAFCDTFDAPSTNKGRAGELDASKWSLSRMCEMGLPSANGRAVAIGPATLPACRAGLGTTVLPSSDSLICDGNAAIKSNHLLMAVAAQNYGQSSYRVRQPFDFKGRTGTIVFDAEGRNVGNQGWISLEITEEPTPAPSFTMAQNFENGAIPRNALEIQLYNNCGSDKVGISHVLSYTSWAQKQIAGAQAICVAAQQGNLNRFEVRLSQSHVDVYATPFSDDGVTFQAAVLLGGFDVALGFSRGYVSFTAHNHATMKYSNNTVDAWVARFDNVAFDGPRITGGWREHEMLDSLIAADAGKVNVGWRLADVSKGPAQTLEIAGVDSTGVTGAVLAVENWIRHEPGADPPPTTYSLNYRLNAKAWKSHALSASQLQMMSDLPAAGTLSMLLDIDVADLVAGKNTVQFTTSNVPTEYPPVVLNVDLILRTE